MIAIVPARCGSKGLPGKNTMSLNGRPLIAYTIEAAVKSECVTDIIVSTDCVHVERVATKYGATSPFLRPDFLATEHAKAIDNYVYTIDRLVNDYEYKIDEFVVLQPTSPLRTSYDIDCAIKLFYEKKADSVVSYTEEAHPIGWHKYIDAEGKFENIFQDKLLNRQEHKISYYPNGAVFVFKVDLIKNGKYYGDNSFPIVMPRCRSVDIDTIDDFKYAEFLMKDINDR